MIILQVLLILQLLALQYATIICSLTIALTPAVVALAPEGAAGLPIAEVIISPGAGARHCGARC